MFSRAANIYCENPGYKHTSAITTKKKKYLLDANDELLRDILN